jgi:hypothetical protein
LRHLNIRHSAQTPCDQPPVPGTELQKSTKHYSRWVRSGNDPRFS